MNTMDKKEVLKLKEGTYLDTPVKEYRSWPATNYSSLADFNESQDHALMEKPAKSYFEFGNAFELMIEDRAKGTKKFFERFFICDASGEMPDDLAGWIESGEDLKSKYKWNKPDKKTGEIRLSRTSERFHKWLDECQANPGMMPMGVDQLESLSKMVENFMLLQPFADLGNTSTMAEILPVADFQVPILWNVGKNRRKALIDILIITNETVYVFDIKTAADMKRFQWMLKDRYWLQEVHYSSGLGRIFTGKEIVWRFLVASKAAPWLSQPFCIDKYSRDATWDRYLELCDKHQEWVDAGRPPKGWKETESIKVYFN